jgi:hypothetical protein
VIVPRYHWLEGVFGRVNDAQAEYVTCLAIWQDVRCLNDAPPELAITTRRHLRPLVPSYGDPPPAIGLAVSNTVVGSDSR